MAIESLQNVWNNVKSFSGAEAAASEKGSFMGGVVQVAPTPEDLLADAAEELSFSADTTDDFELEERKEKEKSIKAQEERVQMYQELMHQAGKSEQLGGLRDSLRTRADSRRALDKAREYFPDPTDAWAALQQIRDELAKDGASEAVLRDIGDAIAELEEKEGPAIRAGLHGALASAGYEDVGSADDLRDLYRDTVCAFSSVNDVFEHIQSEYGGDFERAMDFLFAALSADISSGIPSLESTRLESVHDSLGKVRLTQSAYRLCETMMDRWENVHGIKQGKDGLTSMDLLRDVVGFKDIRFLGGMHVEPLAQKAHAPDIEREVLFLQEMLNTVRKFPTELFDGAQGRMNVLDAVQEAVDHAIEREDEYLAQQEQQ